MMTAKAAHRKDLSGKPATMTHQHYREIARIIRSFGGDPDGYDFATQKREMAEHFADELVRTNPKFDRARFLAACQPTGDAD